MRRLTADGGRVPQRAVSRRALATLVTPRAAHDALAGGRGALLDVRAADGGVVLHADATRMPYEAILGST